MERSAEALTGEGTAESVDRPQGELVADIHPGGLGTWEKQNRFDCMSEMECNMGNAKVQTPNYREPGGCGLKRIAKTLRRTSFLKRRRMLINELYSKELAQRQRWKKRLENTWKPHVRPLNPEI